MSSVLYCTMFCMHTISPKASSLFEKEVLEQQCQPLDVSDTVPYLLICLQFLQMENRKYYTLFLTNDMAKPDRKNKQF